MKHIQTNRCLKHSQARAKCERFQHKVLHKKEEVYLRTIQHCELLHWSLVFRCFTMYVQPRQSRHPRQLSNWTVG